MQSLSESNEDNSQEEYEVKKILRQRKIQKIDKKTGRVIEVTEYLVKWVGYKNPTWEPEENLEHCHDLLKEFLLSEIIKKLKEENNEKSHSKDKNKKLLKKKRNNSDNSDNDDSSEEENDNDSSTNYYSMPRCVNRNNKNKMKKLSLDEDDICEDEEDSNGIDMNEKEDNIGIKIRSIKSMIIPNEKNAGIKFNINYEKGGKTFIDIFDAKSKEIPSEYLIKYYEKFICDNNKGFLYNEEMAFE